MRKILAFLLVLAVVGSFSCLSVFADSAPFTVEATQNGDTVTVSVKTSQEITFYNFTLKLAADPAFTLTAISQGADYSDFGFGSPASNTTTGIAVMSPATASNNNKTVAAGKEVLTFTYSGASTAAANSYTFTLTVNAAGDFDGNNLSWNKATTSGTLTISAATPSTGYTVTPSASAASVEQNGSVNVMLDVTNSDSSVKMFNAFYTLLTYNANLFTYSGGSLVGDYTVADQGTDNGSGLKTLKISRTGNAVSMTDAAELTLTFTATGSTTGDCTFALTKAQVDVTEKAEENAPDASRGSPVTVTVAQSTKTLTSIAITTAPSKTVYTVGDTFDPTGMVVTAYYDNDTSVGTVVTGYTTTPATTLTASDTTVTVSYTEGSVTVTATTNITVNAYTLNATTTDYCGSFKLLKVTVTGAQSGQIPKYDGNPMFTLSGGSYDNNAYYYVVTSYEAAKLTYASGTAATLGMLKDVNQTGLIDINDAQFVYNIYNGATPSQNVVARLLLADANGDCVVNVSDCAAVVDAIS